MPRVQEEGEGFAMCGAPGFMLATTKMRFSGAVGREFTRTVLRVSFPEVPRLISYMDGGTVYLMCFVSDSLVNAGVDWSCSSVRVVLCPSLSVDGSSIFF